MTKTDNKGDKPNEHGRRRTDSWRETIESVVVAFILAFLFRTFEAEAFVIPTGSMAPTLMGRHKVVHCEKCGYRFPIGASDEVEQSGYVAGLRIAEVVCPNCRYMTPKDVVRGLPVFNGDRILVNKFPYEFGDPKRWDVLVFKYPEEPKTNYIKRLVGLPGEKIHIVQGDVYLESKKREISILRKDDANKQRQLQILVYDNDFPARDLRKQGWPSRWAAVKQDKREGNIAGWTETDDGWTEDADERSFRLETSNGYHWLRYRHFVPREEDWEAVVKGRRPPPPTPQLITDFCGYNAYLSSLEPWAEPDIREKVTRTIDYGQYWVGDLTINCEVNVEELGSDPRFMLELNEGENKYRCVFDVASGTATLLHNITENADDQPDEWVTLASAETRFQGTGRFRVSFANVDDRLCVWVKNKLVDFGRDSEFHPKGDTRGYQPAAKADVIPVGIAAKGLTVSVSHLLLQRDIYYRGEHVASDDDYRNIPDSTPEYGGKRDPKNKDIQTYLNQLVYNPEDWEKEYSSKKVSGGTVFARLDDDEFFVMGDNSPRSKDSRLWSNKNRRAKHRHAVPRSKLVGKAFLIYWPHGVPFLNGGKGYPVTYHRTADRVKTDYPSFRLPFYPNFKRMKRIR